MEQLKMDIEVIDDHIETLDNVQKYENVIFIDGPSTPPCYGVSQITISGKYSRKYTVVAFCIHLSEQRVLIEDDLLIICLWDNLLVVDLKADKLLHNIEFSGYEMFRIFKFKSGFFIYGEGENRFLNKDFEVVWELGAIDIFANPEIEKAIEIFDDYVTVFDWYGYKHYYNESGEFKTEHYPEYDCGYHY